MKLTLQLEIEYDLNGEKESTMKNILMDGIMKLADDGNLTGETSAEVVTWESTFIEKWKQFLTSYSD